MAFISSFRVEKANRGSGAVPNRSSSRRSRCVIGIGTLVSSEAGPRSPATRHAILRNKQWAERTTPDLNSRVIKSAQNAHIPRQG
jgi:hypothetical protein